MTLYRDGSTCLWPTDLLQDKQATDKAFMHIQKLAERGGSRATESGDARVACSAHWCVGVAPQMRHIRAKKINNLEEITDDDKIIELPEGLLGVEYASFLSDSLLLGLIAGGKFYLIDLGENTADSASVEAGCDVAKIAGQTPVGKKGYQVQLKIESACLAGSVFRSFATDLAMTKLVLNADNCYIYDLCKAIKWYRVLQSGKEPEVFTLGNLDAFQNNFHSPEKGLLFQNAKNQSLTAAPLIKQA